MIIKSTISKTRYKTEVERFVGDNPLPPEEWPTLIEPSTLFPVATTDPDPESTIVQANGIWTTPTATVTFVMMAAEVQISPTPPASGYQIIKQVPGVDESFEDLGLRDVYAGFFGYFVPSDVGKYVPYIMKFTDEYGREEIVKTDVGIITAA